VDHGGAVYVADTRNARIQRLSPLGQVLAVWNRGANGESLECPVGAAVDVEGNVYVTDSGDVSCVVKFSPWGAWLGRWILPRDRAGGYVQGVAITRSNEVYVTAYSPNYAPSVLRLSATGEVVDIWT
jgi:sugar lactone lactonase YvrE